MAKYEKKKKAQLDGIDGFMDGFVTPAPKPRDNTYRGGWLSRKHRAIDHLINLIDKNGDWEELAKVWLGKLKEGDYQFFREFLDRRDGRTKAATDVEVSGKIEIKVIYANIEINGDIAGTTCRPDDDFEEGS